MKPTSRLLSDYFRDRFGASPRGIRVEPLGRGSHGQGFRVSFEKNGKKKTLIVKTLDGKIGLGHDYPSDRAGVFIQARGSYSGLPRHVRAVDVLAVGRGGRVFSIDGGREYCLVMEEAGGEDYFRDLALMAGMDSLDEVGRGRVSAMARYLAGVHAKKKDNAALYYRKIRDTIGHGECLMGVLDTYDIAGGAGFTSLAEMADIEKACVDWRARLKTKAHRLCRVHGDFHPGNIRFTGPRSFRLLDRSRGSFGEAADDLTALSINYVFFSLIAHGKMAGAYGEALALFFEEYLAATGDRGVMEVTAPFYAFRGVVVANPLFYPDVTDEVRAKLFAFVHGVLRAESFEPSKVDGYIKSGQRARKRFA